MSRLFDSRPLIRFALSTEFAESGCLVWTGSKTEAGYGLFWDGERNQGAHRWSYRQFVGEIPDGLEIDHLCRNPSCVNPEHLEAVTSSENHRRSWVHRERQHKTHCKRGHSLEDAYVNRNGGRACRKCTNAIRLAAYYRRKQAAAEPARGHNHANTTTATSNRQQLSRP